MSVNQVTLVGRLSKKPELSYTPDSTPVLNFTVVTSESWKDKQGKWQEKAEFHNCVMWGKSSETMAKSAQKGSWIYVEGAVQTRSYEKDGKKNYITEIKASRGRVLSDKKQSDTRNYENRGEPLPEKPMSQEEIERQMDAW